MGSKYRLGERIGGGGMAEVFRGTLEGVEGFARSVAIKRMLPMLSADDAFAEMFKNEAKLASLLAHPNCVAVLDFDRDEESRLFLVMELVDGRDLRELQDGGRLPVAVSAFVISQVLRGLAYAHELSHSGQLLAMIHRDVSPHNVLISWDGAVKLSDFGIAKAMGASGASRTGNLKGKVGYMSPEQAHGVALDGRSDVFAVGVMLHELLTGKRLFGGATEAEVLSRMLAQPVESPHLTHPDVSADLAAVCMGMLERDRDRRFASARAALEALLNADVVSVRGQSKLAKLMAMRFERDAPGDANEPAPIAASSTAATPQLRVGVDERAAMEAKTRTEMPGDKLGTPTAAGERAVLGGTRADSKPRRAGGKRAVIVAGVAGVAVAAVGALAFGLGAFDNSDDAGAPWILANAPTAGTDAHPSEPQPAAVSPDASGVAMVVPPDAAPEPKRATRSGKKSRRRGGDDKGSFKRRPVPKEPTPDKKPAVVDKQKRKETKGFGLLYVRVQPWADAKVEGHGHKTTPAVWSLPEGKYKVTFWNEELRRKETRTVRVRSGKPVTVARDWGK